MKHTSRFLAAALAGALALMSGPLAFATSPETFTNGVNGAENAGTTNYAEDSVLVLKELVIHNTDSEAIYLPNVTYNYTITEANVGNGGTTVTDANGTTAIVYSDAAPKALVTTSASVSFSPTTTAGYDSTGTAATITQPMTASVDGTGVYGGFEVEFNTSNFDHPGVFRYLITESSTNRTTAGVTTAADTDATRYLDVYVRGIDSDDDGVFDDYQIYGYVCFQNGVSINPTDTNGASKTNGYVEGATPTNIADQYYTKNLEVKKAFGESALNQTGHQFPFTVTMTSGANGAGAWLNANATTGAKTSGFVTDGGNSHVVLASGGTVVAGLSDQQVLELYGIPTEAGASVTVKERNDTFDVYNLTATVSNSSVTNISAVNGAVAANTDSSTTVSIPVNQNTKTAVLFTNNLTEISPTGIVLRFAPYALMLAAGIALWAVTRRRKTVAE